jgi:hypothetical protein
MCKSGIAKVLYADEDNVRFSIKELGDLGILQLFDASILIFDELSHEIERKLSASLKLDRKATGLPTHISVRLYFAASARQQFVLGLGHLLRGHVTEVFGHVRRAIEGAAIGNLIKSEPDTADLFRNRSRKEFRARTTTGKILPRDGSPLAQSLNKMLDAASKRVHNNFESYEQRLTESFRADHSGYHYKNELFTHEISEENLNYFLSVAIWILRAEELVACIRKVASGRARAIDGVNGLRFYRLLANSLL